MISGQRGLLLAVMAGAIASVPSAAPAEIPVPLLPVQGGRMRNRSSRFTKRHKGGPSAAKKAAKLRKQGQRNARRGR